MGDKWIGKAIKHPGVLHRELNVAAGTKIPPAKMAKAASGSMGPKVARQASLAKTLGGLKRRGK